MSISRQEFGNLNEYKPQTKKWSHSEEEKKKRQKECMERYSEKTKEEKKEYMKVYNKTHRNKPLILGGFSEKGFSVSLVQVVNILGNVLGTGNFTNIRTAEQNRLAAMQRKLKGATVLNKRFEGSHGHHMSEDVIVFIPKKLHESVRHNLETGEGMDEINGKALIWVGRQQDE